MTKLPTLTFLITCFMLVFLAIIAAGCLPASAQQPADRLPPAVAEVITTTLVETRTVPGVLSYGKPIPLRAARTGTITWLAPVGSTVARGEPLFRVDEQPVIAFYGLVPFFRTLEEGVEGADVRQLQENLVELGYARNSTLDGVFSAATSRAVSAWQADAGLPQTGIVDPGQVVFLPEAVRIAEHTAIPGDLAGSTPVLSWSGITRLVTLQLRLADLALAESGSDVSVRLPAGASVSGEIASIGAVVRDGAVEVTVTILDQDALGSLEAAPVELIFVSQERASVLAVPVSALLALAEGGYGVELVDGGTTRIVPVRTGMFADGRVEISGEGIAEGVLVGVAR